MTSLDPRNIFHLLQTLRTDDEGNRRFREVHSLPRERFALLLAALIYALLATGNVSVGSTLALALGQIAAIGGFSACFYFFRPRRFRDIYIHLYTAYYVLLFLTVYYSPVLFDQAPDLRPRGYNYLLHLSLLVAQALRPHWRGGATILALLTLHSALILALDPRPFDSNEILRFTLFVWMGAIVLYIERLNYLNSYKFFQITDSKRREREELRLAERVHKNLFPNFQENDSMRLFARRQSPELIGGDFYDLVYLREGNLGLFFTDISGHGISAAMMSGAVKVILQGMPYRNRMDPPRLLTHVDQVMHREYGSHHASAVYLFLDFQARSARIANAGHPPILYSPGGDAPFTEIESDGALLGYGLRDPIADEIELPLRSGDRFLVYSDGLLECRGKGGRSFMPHIEDFLDGLENVASEDLPDEMLKRVRGRSEFAGFRDDVMLVVLEVK